MIKPEVSETLSPDIKPPDAALELAKRKVNSITKEDNTVYIAADTVVEFGGQILGKPKDEEDAFRMLRLLSGKWHLVHTGVSVATKDKTTFGVKTTKVNFMKLTDKEIMRYIKSYKPLDKAGAYGIQDGAEVFVEKIEGSYSNVVGLPLNLTYKLLKEVDYQSKDGFH